MKVNIEFGAELDTVVQEHLTSGVPVQIYVRAAVVFFNKLFLAERSGGGRVCVGYGDASRFKSYNTEVSPDGCLQDLLDCPNE